MDDESTNAIVNHLWRSILNNSDRKEEIPAAIAAINSMGTYLPNKLAIRYLGDVSSGRRDFNSSWNKDLAIAAAAALAKQN